MWYIELAGVNAVERRLRELRRKDRFVVPVSRVRTKAEL
jgi:hypothetical protein